MPADTAPRIPPPSIARQTRCGSERTRGRLPDRARSKRTRSTGSATSSGATSSDGASTARSAPPAKRPTMSPEPEIRGPSYASIVHDRPAHLIGAGPATNIGKIRRARSSSASLATRTPADGAAARLDQPGGWRMRPFDLHLVRVIESGPQAPRRHECATLTRHSPSRGSAGGDRERALPVGREPITRRDDWFRGAAKSPALRLTR
jgi:hypothetical protein